MRRYNKSVGRQSLGWMPLIDWGWRPPMRLPETPAVRNYWNAGVNFAYGGRDRIYNRPAYTAPAISYTPSEERRGAYGGDTMLKERTRPTTSWWDNLFSGPPGVTPENFDRATVYMQYGDTEGARAELGDLFNDVMGAIVPGWDQRPDYLKNLRLKVDPNKILNAAQKIAPGAGGDAIRAANMAGLDVYVDTPGGRVLMTPELAQGIYKNYPMYTQAQGFLSGITSSPMTMVAIGGVALGLFLMLKR